jgi:hypothetical protein
VLVVAAITNDGDEAMFATNLSGIPTEFGQFLWPQQERRRHQNDGDLRCAEAKDHGLHRGYRLSLSLQGRGLVSSDRGRGVKYTWRRGRPLDDAMESLGGADKGARQRGHVGQ